MEIRIEERNLTFQSRTQSHERVPALYNMYQTPSPTSKSILCGIRVSVEDPGMINEGFIELSSTYYTIKFNTLVVTNCRLIDLSVLGEFVRRGIC